MPFHYTTGIATAPNEIDNWFAIFEAWARLIGWTVESGAGTDDIVIRSLGEAGDKTMLFIRVWRVPATNIVRLETRDDAVGTHGTTADNGLNSGGVQFNYWMAADLDSFVIGWERGGTYYLRYAGLLMPFALRPTDETYYSAVMWRFLANSTILRRHDGLWDRDDLVYMNEWITEAAVDRDDGSFPLGGLYFGDRADVAGQFKHMSCRIEAAAINALDTITTQQTSGNTTWIVLQDEAGFKYAMRTGGIAPTGDLMDSGSFSHVSALVTNEAGLFLALLNFMTANGWAAWDISGVSGRPYDWEFNSAGESGTDDIWIRMSWSGANPTYSICVADSALGTPGRHETTPSVLEFWNAWSFPTTLYVSGDRDCVLLTIQQHSYCLPAYAGLVMPTAPGLSSTYMSAVNFERINESQVLLDHTGAWNQPVAWQRGGDDVHCQLSSPNNYDGETNVLWGVNLADPIGAGVQEVIGQVKYMYAHEGDSVAAFDIMRVNGHIYRKFYFFLVNFYGWAMRIA